MLNLILFGPPGSGKGTQALHVAEKYKLRHLSTGDILRTEIKNQTKLGLEARRFMDEGLLVPDEVVIGMIGSALDEHMKQVEGFLFDGFPRTDAQATALDELLEQKGTSISKVLALDVSEEEITDRILKRGETSGRADDKNVETIKNRFRVYELETAPVASHYEAQGKFQKLHGEGDIEQIFASLCSEIDTLV